MPNQQNIKLGYIVADPDLQPRAGMYPDAIEDYASDMRRGDRSPPLTVFYDGKTYWLADDFHRYRAASATGSKTVSCEVREAANGKRCSILSVVTRCMACYLAKRKLEEQQKLAEDARKNPENGR